MIVLGIDFETTGLDFEQDRIIEIGAVLWDTDIGKPIQIFNTLVTHTDAPTITPLVEQLTGINDSTLQKYGQPASEAFFTLTELILKAEFIVAHNALAFDKPMLDAQYLRKPCVPQGFILPPWIDTYFDIPYPPEVKTRKLLHLAAEHGFINPFSHRAVFDVLTMLRILSAYSLSEIIFSAKQPIVNIVASVGFDDRDKAKSRGYRWQGEKKAWVKSIKAHLVERERNECGFPISIQH